jgi:hypothetical protein
VLRYLLAQVDRTSEDDETDAPADPTAAAAAGMPPAPDAVRAKVATGRADGADGARTPGAVDEPRADAPNPEQLELADDPDAPLPVTEPDRPTTAGGATARDRA